MRSAKKVCRRARRRPVRESRKRGRPWAGMGIVCKGPRRGKVVGTRKKKIKK